MESTFSTAPPIRTPTAPLRPLLSLSEAALPAGPLGVTLRRITTISGPDMERLRALFLRLFPGREADADLLGMYASSAPLDAEPLLNYAWLVELHGAPLALRLFSYLPRQNFAHGAFIGVVPEARRLGLASWLVRCTLAQLATDALALRQPVPWGYCAEVERPADARDAATLARSERRLRFHLASGAYILPLDYEEPTLPLGASLVDGKPMHLLWYPLRHTTVHPVRLQTLVRSLYRDIYRLPLDAPLVRRVLRTLPI